MCSEQQAKRDRKRERPLPHRHPGDDVIDQVGGCLRHASGATARAETARHGVAASSNRSCFTTPQIINVNNGAVHTRSCRGYSPPTPPCQDPPRAYDPPRRLAARRTCLTENLPSEARPLETGPLVIERLESPFEPPCRAGRGIAGAGRQDPPRAYDPRATSPRVVPAMTESDNPPSEARPLETGPLAIERLESAFEPPVPSRPRDRQRWAHLYGSGKGLAIAAAARRHRGPCLVIVANAAEAGLIADEVQFVGIDGLEPLAFRIGRPPALRPLLTVPGHRLRAPRDALPPTGASRGAL